MLAFVTAALASGSVFLFSLWYVRSKNRMELRLRSLNEQQRLVIDQQDPFAQRVAFPVVDSLVRRLMDILPTSLINRARRLLVIAGDTTTASQFFTIVLILATALPVGYFLVAWAGSGGSLSTKALIPIPLLALGGAFAPYILLRRVAKNRQKKIWKSMPGAIDLLTTCVEAGLSLDFALQRVAERYAGPLSDEIQRALREMRHGKTRREALEDMARRVEVPDLMTFVNSIIQAETLGTSVGNVLRAQATQMRMRRRQYAEQQARRAPAKMVFALVFLLIPSMFIVTIGPVVLNLARALSKSGG